MRNLKKKVTTLLLAGFMAVASLVPAKATWGSTDFEVGINRFTGYAFCGDYNGTAETERDYDVYDPTTSKVYAGFVFYALNLETGVVEYGSNSQYGEDYVIVTVTIPEDERSIYVGQRVEAEFFAKVGSESGRDDVTVYNN